MDEALPCDEIEGFDGEGAHDDIEIDSGDELPDLDKQFDEDEISTESDMETDGCTKSSQHATVLTRGQAIGKRQNLPR